MRVLLDSNIWRYLVDADAIARLQAITRRTNIRILVAPAVLYEALRLRDEELRRRLVTAMTLPAWRRLMPEAYSESNEFKDEVRRLRPQWLRQKADLAWYRRLYFD